ncbi:MAG: DUF2780 domain-containing protein [Gammaproteobacteria bacterium]|nr:DUF2780 domain-containing protein [Gammaproteobacteria bacterium]
MKNYPFKRAVLISILTLLSSFTNTALADAGLINLLTSNLGVTQQQAEGGAGAIFGLAKQNMPTSDFAQLGQAVPGIGSLIEAAPKTSGLGSSLGGVTSMLGGSSGSLGGLAALGESFGQLGMSADMVTKFAPIILDYVKQKGGDGVMGMLQSALQ